MKNATFIPPNVDDMHDALSKLELYIHKIDYQDPLIRIALIHYQFETIHPFLDGNGRIGRLLISLLLKQYGLLKDDTLYLSYYLKRNRMEYYDRLMDVRLKGHFEAWITFFISGIIESAMHAINSIESLIILKQDHLKLLQQLQGNQNNQRFCFLIICSPTPLLISNKQASASTEHLIPLLQQLILSRN